MAKPNDLKEECLYLVACENMWDINPYKTFSLALKTINEQQGWAQGSHSDCAFCNYTCAILHSFQNCIAHFGLSSSEFAQPHQRAIFYLNLFWIRKKSHVAQVGSNSEPKQEKVTSSKFRKTLCLKFFTSPILLKVNRLIKLCSNGCYIHEKLIQLWKSSWGFHAITITEFYQI